MKTCRSCKKRLPLSEFYVHAQMADGHLNKCKVCVKNRVKTHRIANVDAIRAYDRERYYRDPEPRKEAMRISAKLRGSAYATERARIWRGQNPEKYRAHSAVSNALRRGKLERKPCEVCGNAKAQAHHDDYSKPLDVRWLCHVHHARHHAIYGPDK